MSTYQQASVKKAVAGNTQSEERAAKERKDLEKDGYELYDQSGKNMLFRKKVEPEADAKTKSK